MILFWPIHSFTSMLLLLSHTSVFQIEWLAFDSLVFCLRQWWVIIKVWYFVVSPINWKCRFIYFYNGLTHTPPKLNCERIYLLFSLCKYSLANEFVESSTSKSTKILAVKKLSAWLQSKRIIFLSRKFKFTCQLDILQIFRGDHPEHEYGCDLNSNTVHHPLRNVKRFMEIWKKNKIC